MEDGTDQNDTQQFENIIDLVLSTGSDTSTSQLMLLKHEGFKLHETQFTWLSDSGLMSTILIL